MVKLQEDVDQKKRMANLIDKMNFGGDIAETPPKRPASNLTKSGDEHVDFHKFGQLVLKAMQDDEVQATPKNFDIYFWKLLENKSAGFQSKVLEQTDYDNNDANKHQASLEEEVRLGFGQIKNMLSVIALIYKNLVVMKGLSKKRLNEAKSSQNALDIQNVIKVFGDELDKINALMERHLDIIKTSYESVDKIFKNVEENSIYDTKFGVYNKKYFLKSIESELSNVARYNYSVSLMLIHVKDSVLSEIASIKDKNGILRNIAKILLKSSRRTDLVAHYGEGCFGMVMKHTNLESAKKAAERISGLLYQTTFFIGEEELDIDIEFAVAPLDQEYSVEETISAMLDALPKSGKNLNLYEVAELA